MKAAVSLDWLLAGFMGLLLPIAPLVASILARDSAYLWDYRRSLVKSAGHLRSQVRSRAFSRYVLYGRLHKPVGETERETERETLVGECTHCGNCCMHRSCVFLDWSPEGASRCRIYNSSFWKQLACGRYPESSLDIALYDCPRFTAVPPGKPAAGVQVIPVVAIHDRE